MFNIPMQTLFGAGLLLTLAFSVNDRSPVPGRADADSTIRLACDDGGSSRNFATAPNSERDAHLCR
ncbi:MAG TPA: hypothetical protein VK479_15240 [Micropepsaceae bacterium]|nr:hypothetical protein [Micropepsaceae bacterium]